MKPERYQIEVLDTKVCFSCAQNESILDAMKREGCGPLHYGCFGGGCGVCRMRIVSGSYVLVQNMSRAHVTRQEQENGIVLICCVHPRGNVIIARI